MADPVRVNGKPVGMNVEQKVFLLAFTAYTASRLANEQVAIGEDGCELNLSGPGADDVFPAWTGEDHTLDVGKGQVVRTNNMRELNAELAMGWKIQQAVQQHDACVYLMVMERVINSEKEADNMSRNKSTAFVDPDMGKPWYIRAVLRGVRTFLNIRYGRPPVVHSRKHNR
ncbi:MAG: hypothetical protein ACI96M_000410 [Candidatus Azotimanducaceae bacterium]|jgi:hypothetical protein